MFISCTIINLLPLNIFPPAVPPPEFELYLVVLGGGGCFWPQGSTKIVQTYNFVLMLISMSFR